MFTFGRDFFYNLSLSILLLSLLLHITRDFSKLHKNPNTEGVISIYHSNSDGDIPFLKFIVFRGISIPACVAVLYTAGGLLTMWWSVF